MAIIASHNGRCNKHRSRSVHHRELNHIYPVMVINTEPELRTILLQKVFFHFNRFEKQMDTKKSIIFT